MILMEEKYPSWLTHPTFATHPWISVLRRFRFYSRLMDFICWESVFPFIFGKSILISRLNNKCNLDAFYLFLIFTDSVLRHDSLVINFMNEEIWICHEILNFCMTGDRIRSDARKLSSGKIFTKVKICLLAEI